ncbi:MAG: nucleotide sugar dehydrogenase [Chthoniobacterales bacterium]
MKVVVAGLWHLGCVTAACAATKFRVVGLDFDEAVVAELNGGRAPIAEPGLNELTQRGLGAGRLRFTADAADAGADADLLWVCWDTPVDAEDVADVEWVIEQVRRAVAGLRTGALVLVSSQVPVGTGARLAEEFPGFRWAYSPENLRLGKAIAAFTEADRAIVGCDEGDRGLLGELFAPFAKEVIFMRMASAEMVKHGLNSFLALSITFINEIGRLCELTGADAAEVSAGLKSDVRIGKRAYLGAGGPFAGGTLARDVVALSELGRKRGETLEVIPAIKRSNDRHRGWAFSALERKLGGFEGKRVAVLGLVYTVGTNTLRRSAAVELCEKLVGAAVDVRAFDPAVEELPRGLTAVTLAGSVAEALAGADAAVVCTAWPEFREIDWGDSGMRGDLVVDADGFLGAVPGLRCVSVGRSAG